MKKKISWGDDIYDFKINYPIDDINILKHDNILSLNINRLNTDYKLKKRKNYFNLNDIIKIKFIKNNKKFSLNENIEKILKLIPNEGIIGKIININLWEPSFNSKIRNKEYKIIPGSFIIAYGNYSKIVKEIDVEPKYKLNEYVTDKNGKNIYYIFDIHFRDLDLVFTIDLIK